MSIDRRVLGHALLSFVATLALLEVTARILFIAPPIDGFNRISYSHVFSTDKPTVPLVGGGYTWISRPDGQQHVHHLNSLGFRDIEWDLHDRSRHRVAFVGDSFVEGFLAANDDTIPAIFRSLARDEQLDAYVMNLGVGAAQPDAYCRLIRDAIPALGITQVVLVLYANDFVRDLGCRSIFSERAAKTVPVSPLHSRLIYVAQFLESHGLAPWRWRLQYSSFVPAVPDPGNPWTSNERNLRPFVRDAIADDMKAARFNPYVTNAAMNFEATLRQERDVGRVLEPIRAYLARAKVGFSVLYIPYMLQVSPRYEAYVSAYSQMPAGVDWRNETYRVHERAIAAYAREHNVPFAALTDNLRAADQGPMKLYGGHDEHLRVEGNRIVAKRAFALLKPTLGAQE